MSKNKTVIQKQAVHSLLVRNIKVHSLGSRGALSLAGSPSEYPPDDTGVSEIFFLPLFLPLCQRGRVGNITTLREVGEKQFNCHQ